MWKPASRSGPAGARRRPGRRAAALWIAVALAAGVPGASPAGAQAGAAAPPSWTGDLSPVSAADWTPERAAHLASRTGFGATPEDIARLAALTPAEAVRALVRGGAPGEADGLAPFDASGVHDPGLEPFPPSRPATTRLARERGEALGVKVKPSGDRPLQPVVNRFFYWLRASSLETDRLAYWWAGRMLSGVHPLREKMALFWHGHFAVSEAKIRDYRKHEHLLGVLHRHGRGDFRELLVAAARSPAMLSFLDAGVNVKGAPNENFAREIMELFTMGVGNYGENDIREAARAFTGWNYRDMDFVVDAALHDDGAKTVLGETAAFDGVAVIDLILRQPVTAEFVAAKIHRYLVREEVAPELRAELGAVLRDSGYDIGALLETILLSRDFYAAPSVATRIRGPVETMIATYRLLGLERVPGAPDFNLAAGELGQRLFRPPTVAGWAGGRAWITPGLLLARGNFVYDVLFPDINFIPRDRYPLDPRIRDVSDRIAEGVPIGPATVPEMEGGARMSMSNTMADRDEAFNTRYGSYKGWQMAIQRVKPVPRHTAAVDLSAQVRAAGLATAGEAVDFFLARLLRAPVDRDFRDGLEALLVAELGTDDLAAADSYMEEALRLVVHLAMSTPAYQLG